MKCQTILKVFPAPSGRAKRPGTVKGQRRCQLEGCNGMRIIVKWPDGKVTHPCTKGMVQISENAWQITDS
jgi:hypothetical protein